MHPGNFILTMTMYLSNTCWDTRYWSLWLWPYSPSYPCTPQMSEFIHDTSTIRLWCVETQQNIWFVYFLLTFVLFKKKEIFLGKAKWSELQNCHQSFLQIQIFVFFFALLINNKKTHSKRTHFPKQFWQSHHLD